jgi:recombination protein RecR
MRKFPLPIQAAQAAFQKLPGVGPKTALRYVFQTLRLSADERLQMVRALQSLDKVRRCDRCFTYTEQSPCDICTDTTRSDTTLCVVAESRDIATMEATGIYRSRYFVLGGVLNPVDGQTPDKLNVRALAERLKTDPAIQEIILAFSPDVHGETTILYLARLLKPLNKKITRLARGLPMGADIEYADEVTLASALQGRSET